MSQVKVGTDVLEQYARYYDSGPSEWRRLGAIDKAANIVALCQRCAPESVLEIGAGDGSILSRLSELNFGERLYALEISASGVAVIKNRNIARLVDCEVFDGYRAPYPDRQFDLAILSHVVEHVEHPRQVIREDARVAKHVFIEAPTEDITRRAIDYVPDSVGHINFYSPRTIRWLVQSCGLVVLDQKTTNPSKATYVHQSGRKGAIHFLIKEGLLRWAPAFATRHFCYHESLLATAAAGTGEDPAR